MQVEGRRRGRADLAAGPILAAAERPGPHLLANWPASAWRFPSKSPPASTTTCPVSSATSSPVLSRAGCNAGTCHGAAKGKNGFKLSLRGYDPLVDHRALTDDLASRRINAASPGDSLMLLEADGRRAAPGRAGLRAGLALLSHPARAGSPRARRLDLSAAARGEDRNFSQGPGDRRASARSQQMRDRGNLCRRDHPRRDPRGLHRKRQHRGRRPPTGRACSPPCVAARPRSWPVTKAPTRPPRSR